MSSAQLSKQDLQLAADTIRFVAVDAVEKANSGHPGMPMGMAEIASVLWLKHLRFNPKDPKWIGRDRFVLSNGHGSMLLYALLHLSGYDLSLEDLKQFRQPASKTPGHPECFITPGVETTTGPLGQGVGNSVGMALAQKMMSARYASSDFDPVAQRIYCFAGDGCLMEGVSCEASSLAGHLGLGNLIVVYDDNHVSIAGNTSLAFSEDVGKRYEAYGWHVQHIDGHDFDQIDAALAAAQNETARPSIIVARTVIGRGAPKVAGTAEAHGAPLGAAETAAAKKNMNWPEDKSFYVPPGAAAVFARRGVELQAQYVKWQDGFASWAKGNQEKAKNLKDQLALDTPADLEEKLISAVPADNKANSTRKLSSLVLQKAAASLNFLAGGSADLEPSTLTLIKDSSSIAKGSFGGVNIHFGVREHAMGAMLNGLAYYGGFQPFGSTFFCFLDYMKPAVRLAALSHLPVIFIYTHDTIFLGEDGPTHQPIEHLAMLRSLPHIYTFRPADGLETAVCYAQALARREGPSAMILSRQNIESFSRPQSFTPADIRRGAYTVLEPEDGKSPDLVIVATGSEVPLAVSAAKLLSADARIRVVSMPCWNIFAEQSEAYRAALIPPRVRKVVIEAASPFGWHGMLDTCTEELLVIGIEDRFGTSAPQKAVAEKFGFTPAQVEARIRSRFF